MHRLDSEALRRLIEVGRSLVSDLELERVLESVLEAAKEVTGARYAAIGVLDEAGEALERFVFLGIDEPTRQRIGDLPRGQGVLGTLIRSPTPLRLTDVAGHPDSFGFPPNHPPMRTFLGVPITIRGHEWGNLYLTEKDGGGEFGEADEVAAVALADWAAIAIHNAHSVASERLRFTMEAAEQERMQWARELHDETLQGLAAVRLLLATGMRRDPDQLGTAVQRSVEQIDHEIASLRALITDLRPDSLRELGVGPALQSLASRVAERADGVAIEIDLEPGAEGKERLPAGREIAIYRIAQEAINNAIRHGGAARIRVGIKRTGPLIEAEIRDDGAGFDPGTAHLGFGIVGMRERAELAGGELEISSAAGAGTVVRAVLPAS